MIDTILIIVYITLAISWTVLVFLSGYQCGLQEQMVREYEKNIDKEENDPIFSQLDKHNSDKP